MDAETVDRWLLVAQTIGVVISSASLVALVVYVVKTWHIATATSRSADATRDAAEATKRSAKATLQSVEVARESAAASLLAAQATARSAEISERTLQEMRDSRDQETAPYVIVSFDVPTGRHLIYLVVRNIGQSIAEDVRLSFEPPLEGAAIRDVPALPFLQHGFSVIAPGQEIRTIIDTAPARLGDNNTLPLQYTVTVTYTGGLSRAQRRLTHRLDLRSFKGVRPGSEVGMKELIKEIANVRASLDVIAGVLERSAPPEEEHEPGWPDSEAPDTGKQPPSE